MDSCLNSAGVQNAGNSVLWLVIGTIWIFLFGVLVGFCCASIPYEHPAEETARKTEVKSSDNDSDVRHVYVFTTKYGRSFHTQSTCWHLRDKTYWTLWRCKDCAKSCPEALNDAAHTRGKWIDDDDEACQRHPKNDVYDFDETEVQHAGLHE